MIMIKKYMGWGLIIITSLLLPILELVPLDNMPPWLLIIFLLLVVVFVFGGLFLGQLFLIWRYLEVFKRWQGFAFSLLGFIALFTLWYQLNDAIVFEGANYWLNNLSFLVTLWVTVSTVTIGIVIFIYFIFNEYGIRFMAVAILIAIFGFYFLVEQLGGETLFVNTITMKIPFMGITPCLLMWFILAGLTTFIGRFFWFGYKELSEPSLFKQEVTHE